MDNSSIIDEVICLEKEKIKISTHFAFCVNRKIRYLISIKGGKKKIATNLSSYSKKHFLLMKLFIFLPLGLLKTMKLGYFVQARFCDEIDTYIKSVVKNEFSCAHYQWNMIIGTYDNKQKLVVQCFDKRQSAVFLKIGNQNTAKEMLTEIDFLYSNPQYKTFDVPIVINKRQISDEYRFNIQVSKEFSGDKVAPVMNKDMYEIFNEITNSKDIKMVDGVPKYFSHGDFTPWNLKVQNGKYTLFDWEHCGMRFYGFDYIHFIYKIEILLNKTPSDKAIRIAIKELKKINPKNFTIPENIETLYFEECKNTF